MPSAAGYKTFSWCVKSSFGDTSGTDRALKNVYLPGTLCPAKLKDMKSDLTAFSTAFLQFVKLPLVTRLKVCNFYGV